MTVVALPMAVERAEHVPAPVALLAWIWDALRIASARMSALLTLLRWIRNIAGFLGGICLLGLVLAPIITLFDKSWDPPAPFTEGPATLGTYMWQTAVFMIGAFIVWWLASAAAVALMTRAGAFDDPPSVRRTIPPPD